MRILHFADLHIGVESYGAWPHTTPCEIIKGYTKESWGL